MERLTKRDRYGIPEDVLAPIDAYEGLKRKYIVRKSDTGEAVDGSFVLRPDKDTAAVVALRAYARATDNETLAADIIKWVGAEESDPLTLEDLKGMDGEPVWREQPGHDGRWVFVDCFWKINGVIYLHNIHGSSELAEFALEKGVKLYRRRPEGAHK